MSFTRRTFLERAGLALLPGRPAFASQESRRAPKLIDPGKLSPFVDPLPVPAIARPVGKREGAWHYRMAMREISARVHRDLPLAACWSYGDSLPGPTIETRSGEALSIEWMNQLPARHFLPIDHRLCGAEKDKPEVRTVAHVHGAIVPAESDGYPESWFAPGQSVLYHYPNRQDSGMLWYHDHAMGIERLNVYAGLFGAFFVRDAQEDSLQLPNGAQEVPLILFDRMFREDGALYYPESYDPAGPWVPECFGNCQLVNGKIFPYLEVAPRRYRFRVLNAANARFFHLTLDNNQMFRQIGADQGFLQAPADIKRLSIAPGERADLIIDFSAAAGQSVVLKNEVLPLMQFRVASGKVDDASRVPDVLRPIAKIPESEAVVSRVLTLRQHNDLTGKPMRMLLDGKRWMDAVSEKPVQHSVEIWSLVNLSSDTHPIHLHQTRFQILDRRNIDVAAFALSGTLRYRGAAMPPAPNEAGWKDTVRANSKSVTRIIVRFDGYAGRYVWHCHVLEHAANEMMRPYEIVAAS
jgi:spore coat protein A, manganese oxidase